MKFLEDFNTLYNSAPFNKIQLTDYIPNFKDCIESAKNEVEAISNSSEKPTFENTVSALDFAGQPLDRLSSIFFNLNSAETSDEMQKIAQEVSPWLTEFSNDITLNENLFKRIKSVYDEKDTLNLTTEQQTLLEKKYKGFVRNGALLNEEENKNSAKSIQN